MRVWRRQEWLILGLLLLLARTATAASATAVEGYSSSLADMLLSVTGTEAVFDSARIQAALQDPQPLLLPTSNLLDPLKVQKLFKQAGFRFWNKRPRVWIVMPAGSGDLELMNTNTELQAAAQYRALPLSQATIQAGDTAAIAVLQQNPEDKSLDNLLSTHQADALVIVTKGPETYAWQLLSAAKHLSGSLPLAADVPALLPHLLCEVLATPFQWPEAAARSLLEVSGIGSFADLSALQADLRQQPGVPALSLVRVDGTSVWYGVDAAAVPALLTALAGDGRLTEPGAAAGLKPEVVAARKLAAVVLSRAWHPLPTASTPTPAGTPVASP